MKSETIPIIAFDSRLNLPFEARYLLSKCSRVFPLYVISNTKQYLPGTNLVSPQSLNYASAYSDFLKTYVHLSPNSKTYELACFERYFAYLALAKKFGWNYFWVIDTDVLVTPSLALWNSFRNCVFSAPNPDDAVSAHCALFTLSDLEKFVAYLRSVYFSEFNLPKLQLEFANKQAKSSGGINDMTALAQWLKDDNVTWVNAEEVLSLPRISHVFPSEFLAKSPSVCVTVGEKITLRRWGSSERDQFCAIHFQGGAKLMIFAMIFGNGNYLTSNSWVALEQLSSKLASGLHLVRRLRSNAKIPQLLRAGRKSENPLG